MSLKLVKTIDPVGSVCGVAFLKYDIYILTSGCISVYTSLSMSHDHVKTIVLPPEIEINEDMPTGNIAASEKNGCIYLRSGNSVWKFTAECDQTVLWLSIKRQITSISAARDENVLIGTSDCESQIEDQIAYNKFGFECNGGAMLHVYSPNAKVVKQFMFLKRRGNLRQAIAVSSGNIIVAFSKGQEILEMNQQGVIVRAYKHSYSCDHTVRKVRSPQFDSKSSFYVHKPTASLQRSSACIGESGRGRIFIGYESLNCNECASDLVVIDSEFQLQQKILPNLHYNCRNFQHMVFNQSHSLLLTSCDRYQGEEAIAKEVTLFDIRNA